MIKKYSINAKRNYEKDGEKKTLWLGIGTLIEFENGNKIIELNMIPNEQYHVFEIEKKDKNGEWRGRGVAASALAKDMNASTDDVELSDIPF